MTEPYYPTILKNIKFGYKIRRCKKNPNVSDDQPLLLTETVTFPYSVEPWNELWPAVQSSSDPRLYVRLNYDQILESIKKVGEVKGAEAKAELEEADGCIYVCPTLLIGGHLIDLSEERNIKYKGTHLQGLQGWFMELAHEWYPSFCSYVDFSLVFQPDNINAVSGVYEAVGRYFARNHKQAIVQPPL